MVAKSNWFLSNFTWFSFDKAHNFYLSEIVAIKYEKI